MSEKFRYFWRKVNEHVLHGTAMPVVLSIGIVIAMIVIKGIVFYACWNIAITKMFRLVEVTILEAVLLTFTIDSLRANYFYNLKSKCIDIKIMLLEKGMKEKLSNVVSVMFIIMRDSISALIGIWATMYSWNNIIQDILNIELVQINLWQALVFACLFNLLFKIPKSIVAEELID